MELTALILLTCSMLDDVKSDVSGVYNAEKADEDDEAVGTVQHIQERSVRSTVVNLS